MPTSWSNQGHHVETPYYGFEHVDQATNHGDTIGGDYAAWLRTQVNDIDAVRRPENRIPKPEHDAPKPGVHHSSPNNGRPIKSLTVPAHG